MKWETEIKSYYSLSHISDLDHEDHYELHIQITSLLRAIHKAKYKLFTPGQLDYVNATMSIDIYNKTDKETRLKMWELLIKGDYYDIITHFLPKRKSKQFDEEILSDLFTCWTNEFKGASLMALCDFVVEQERVWSHGKYYAKIIPAQEWGNLVSFQSLARQHFRSITRPENPMRLDTLPAINRFGSSFPNRRMTRNQIYWP